MNANCRLVAPPPTRRTAIGEYPKVASYDMLGEQLHYSNPVKHESVKLLTQLVVRGDISKFPPMTVRLVGYGKVISLQFLFVSGLKLLLFPP